MSQGHAVLGALADFLDQQVIITLRDAQGPLALKVDLCGRLRRNEGNPDEFQIFGTNDRYVGRIEINPHEAGDLDLTESDHTGLPGFISFTVGRMEFTVARDDKR